MATTITLCLGGCSPKHNSYSDFIDISQNDGWSRKNPMKFEIIYPDSLASYNLSLSLSHDNYFEYRNLWLFVDLISPNGKITRDTLNCDLADKFGKWKSRGFGSNYQYTQQIAKNINSTDYKSVVVWQGMREDTLFNISNIGITLIPTK